MILKLSKFNEGDVKTVKNWCLAGTRVDVVVSDKELESHVFLQNAGFKAVEVLKDCFGEAQDGYKFYHESFVKSDEDCKGV